MTFLLLLVCICPFVQTWPNICSVYLALIYLSMTICISALGSSHGHIVIIRSQSTPFFFPDFYPKYSLGPVFGHQLRVVMGVLQQLVYCWWWDVNCCWCVHCTETTDYGAPEYGLGEETWAGQGQADLGFYGRKIGTPFTTMCLQLSRQC